MAAVLGSAFFFLSTFLMFIACEEVVGNVAGSRSRSVRSDKNANNSLVEHEKDPFIHNGTNSTKENSESDENLVSEFKAVASEMQLMGLEVDENASGVSVSARKMSEIMINPVMLVPQLIVWGFAPILLAKLKLFVLQALLLNHVALNSAIYMTLRNIVFGPRPGPVVKYANYGYSHGPNKFHHHHRKRS